MKIALAILILTAASLSIARADDTSGPEQCLSCASENLPPEMRDVALSPHKDGFIDLLAGYNPGSDFSIGIINIGLRTNSLEYFSGNSIYGPPGGGEPEFYKSKQNLFYNSNPALPLDFSAQAVYSQGQSPIYRIGMRWRVSSTGAFKAAFEKIHLSYSINFQPIQFDSIPGYGWQIEHTYQLDLPYAEFLHGAYLRGVFDEIGNIQTDNDGSDSTFSTSNQFVVPIKGPFSAYTEYKYSASAPSSDYNGVSFGVEYRWSF
jgi:hypothetical protein